MERQSIKKLAHLVAQMRERVARCWDQSLVVLERRTFRCPSIAGSLGLHLCHLGRKQSTAGLSLQPNCPVAKNYPKIAMIAIKGLI